MEKKGNKFDNGKPQLDLVDPTFILGIGEILTFGAEKYGANNWKKVKKHRYIAAAFRHFLAIMKGELYDEQSNRHHALHVACNLMFIFYFDTQNKKGNK